uniref:Ubiquitin-like domain-containing protein n=1 Tax=Hordeum vulgare subsp. vulgare TaxID=112509 RepID=A0A8I6X933_HORVV
MSPPYRGSDSKAAVKPLPVTIKVVSQEKVLRHNMSSTDQLQVLMDAWYHKVPGVTYGTGVFLFEGVRLRGDKTPADLEMEDGDMIDFFEHMDGGAFVA